jgi:hypothetical protein
MTTVLISTPIPAPLAAGRGRAADVRPAASAGFLRTRGIDMVRNVALLAGLWFAYSAARSLTADDMSVALTNAHDLLRFESAIHLPGELWFQQQLVHLAGLMRAANVYYIAIHFPVTIAFLAWAWLRHRTEFGRIRNTLIAVSAAGLVIHALYPLAPPRMTPGFVDTAAVFGPNPYEMGISKSANQIAAMPSLHVGWALIVALGIVSIGRSRTRWIAMLHPLATLFVVVVTANHYWSDAIVAVALVAVAWALTGSRVRIRRPQAGGAIRSERTAEATDDADEQPAGATVLTDSVMQIVDLDQLLPPVDDVIVVPCTRTAGARRVRLVPLGHLRTVGDPACLGTRPAAIAGRGGTLLDRNIRKDVYSSSARRHVLGHR